MNHALFNDAALWRIVTTWKPSGFQNTVNMCFSVAIGLLGKSGHFRSRKPTSDPEDIQNNTNSH
jgi:hypothetical protein